jgi:uncharacterized protein (TIGR02246 family)
LNRFFALMLLFLLVACSPKQDSQASYDQIVAVEQAFMAAFQEENATAIAELYSDEAQLLPSNRDFVSGRHNIKLFWKGLMQLGIATVKLETIEVNASHDQAHEMGRYTIHTADDEMIDYGKYVVVWQKQQSHWFLHRHIWTTSMIKAHESRI